MIFYKSIVLRKGDIIKDDQLHQINYVQISKPVYITRNAKIFMKTGLRVIVIGDQKGDQK